MKSTEDIGLVVHSVLSRILSAICVVIAVPLVGAIVLCIVVFLSAQYEKSDVVVETHEHAFDLMKEEVLSKHFDKLEAVGADESIFENVDMDVGDDWPCNKPARYSSAYRTDFDGVFVKLFENRQAACVSCWDLIKVRAEVSRDGRVYEVTVEKRPSWKRSVNADGTWKRPGDAGERCGPVKVKPSHVRNSPNSVMLVAQHQPEVARMSSRETYPMANTSSTGLSINSIILTSVSLAFFTYLVCSWVLFNDILWPLGFALFWHDRLPIQYWIGPVVVGVLIGAAAARQLWLSAGGQLFAPAIFLLIAMFASISISATHVKQTRSKLMSAFEPDRVIQNSLFRSFRNAPREYQFFLHAAALKDCVPYAWSYRKMGFYRLRNNVAINVLPDHWIEDCNLRLD